nr:coiled-coil domain-containing protein 63-like [Pocillopora verrucosa]
MPCLREEDKVDPLEAQLEAQMELSHLQRQYRCLRNDRRMYTDETENTLRKQKITIEALVKEKKELEAMMHVASSRQNEKFDQRNVEKLVELLEREAQAQEELKKEKEAIAGVDEKVAAMREKINQQSKKMGGSKDVYQEKHVANMKLTRILENRLDEMTKKFSIALTGNLKLREHINHVEGQKARFLDLHKRLQAELIEGKKEIDRISEVATTHFTIRDEAQHRMASLRERADREMAVYNAEIKDVKRILEHDRKLRKFMTTKAEDRASILEDELMVRAIKKYEAQLNGLQQETSKFEEIFDKIKEATGIEDTDTLVESFIENEDRNFALYNYVNNMNTEIENLKDDIRRLKDEIELIKKEGVDSDVHRKEILNELEQKMVEVTDELTLVNKEYKASRRQLELLKPKVESVFNSIECDRSSIAELLGIGVSIDDNNIMQYLGIIEQKCNELLQNKALEKIKKLNESGGDISVDGLQGVGPQPAHGNFLIVPPPIEDDSDQAWHCNDAKPLTVEEVQALIQQGNVKGGLSKVTGSTKQPAKRKRA